MYDNTGRANSAIAWDSASHTNKINLQSSKTFCAIVHFQ